MACYRPLKAYAPLSQADGGRFVFDRAKALNPDNPRQIPCNKCKGCLQDTSESWAIRAYHESMMHEQNSFVTLTYNDDNLPSDYSVDLREVQLFMKKLRKEYGSGIRFFAASEYGFKDFRPHYHLLLNGIDFRSDRKLHKDTRQGPLYTSAKLESIWGKGFCTIGSVTLKSAFYCLQYIFDKKHDDPNRYVRQHPVTSEIVTCKPEFRTMSSKPGLGFTWFQKYKSSCFPSDFLVIEGRHYAVPRYYQQLLEKEAQAVTRHLPAYDLTIETDEHKELQRRKRSRRTAEHKWNSTPERLKVREFIHEQKLKRRKSSL